MLSAALKKLVRKWSLLLRMGWLFAISSVGVYFYVAYQAILENSTEASFDYLQSKIIFGVLAFLCLATPFLLQKFVFNEQRIRNILKQPVDPRGLALNLKTGKVDKQRLLLIEKLTVEEQKLYGLARRTPNVFMIYLGAINTCALFGMVLAVQEGNLNTMIPFIIAAIVVYGFFWPRLERFLERCSAYLVGLP